MFKLGLVINPFAGLGGSVGLKGSDGAAIREEAVARGAEARALARMQRALQPLMTFREHLRIFCFSGDMGETTAQALGFSHTIVGHPQGSPTSAEDTREAAQCLRQVGVDLLVFAGGDGTARDVADAVGLDQAVLGVPAGVKMHSGVYAISPEAAGQILVSLLSRQLVNVVEQDVKDIDEEAFRQGQVRARWYASLRVPEMPQLLQRTKGGAGAVDELAQRDLAAELMDRLNEHTLYIVGPGSTTQVFLHALGLDGTLLGVDLLHHRQLIAKDLAAGDILAAIQSHDGPVKIIITAIGGQGHIIGRGNQQLIPEILRRVGKANLQVIATREKILALEGRPLLIDSNDPQLDSAFSGYIPVIVGYGETILYPLGNHYSTSPV